MYKLVILTTILACATAAPGYIGAGYAAPIAPWGGLAHGYVGAPLVSAHVVKTAVPVATSYSNSVRFASPTLAVAHAPVVAHAPLLAPAYAHAPLLAPAYAHAW